MQRPSATSGGSSRGPDADPDNVVRRPFADFFLSGYFKGKRDAEAKLAQTFSTGGVALRPGFIYGTRQVGPLGIPLQAVGAPPASDTLTSI